MQRNLEINRLTNATLINAFVGGPGSVEGPGKWMTLAEAIDLLKGIPVDFLKVDIEGSEFGLDFDCLDSVKRLAMEIHSQRGAPADLVAKVCSHGFDCRTYDEALRPVASDKADFLLC